MNIEIIVWSLFAMFLAVAVPFAIMNLWRVTRPDYKHWTEQLKDFRPK